MSDIGLDFTVLYVAAALALAAPLVMLVAARWLRPIRLWPRLALVTLGGIGLATLGGAITDALLPDDECAMIAFYFVLPVQALASLGLLVLGHRP